MTSNVRDQKAFKKSLLSHPEDVHCVIFHFLCLSAYIIAFGLYLHPGVAHIRGPWSCAAFVCSAVIMLGWISAVNVGVNFHNHVHRKIFRVPWLNAWFGRLWAVSGGWSSFFWEYSHLVVHHANVLEAKDWTLPKKADNGEFENIYRYCISHWPWRYAYHFWHTFRLGKAGKGVGKKSLRELAIFMFIWSIPFLINPTMALMLWVLPQFFANIVIMGPGMYVQHVGCEAPSATSSYTHSNTFTSRFFNLTMFNIGYHIEHHTYAHIHWSELPRLHQRLKKELTDSHANVVPSTYYYCAGRFLCNPARSSKLCDELIRAKRQGGAIE